MSKALQIYRVRLTAEQMAAALDALRPRRGCLTLLPGLPAVTDPLRILGAKGVLAVGARALDPNFSGAIQTLAAPSRRIGIVVNRPESMDWFKAGFYRSIDRNLEVAFAERGGTFDVTSMPHESQPLVLVDELLGITALPSTTEDLELALDRGAYIALLAMAEALRAVRPAAGWSANPRDGALSMRAGELQHVARSALSGWDTRCALTAARKASAIRLEWSSESIVLGADALVRLGVASASGGRFSLSPSGLRAVRGMNELITTAGITATAERAGRPVTLAHVTIFRCASRIWLTLWSRLAGEEPTCVLLDASAAGTMRLIEELFRSTLADVDVPAPRSIPEPQAPSRRSSPPESIPRSAAPPERFEPEAPERPARQARPSLLRSLAFGALGQPTLLDGISWTVRWFVGYMLTCALLVLAVLLYKERDHLQDVHSPGELFDLLRSSLEDSPPSRHHPRLPQSSLFPRRH